MFVLVFIENFKNAAKWQHQLSQIAGNRVKNDILDLK